VTCACRTELHTSFRSPHSSTQQQRCCYIVFNTEGAEIESDIRSLTGAIVDTALKVHRAFGPGLLESAYEQCLAHELTLRSIRVRRQVALPIEYEGLRLDAVYRLDLVVGERVIVEVKSAEALSRLHEAQLLTYLKISKLKVGLLINSTSTYSKMELNG
jgi:GxxExxY protein